MSRAILSYSAVLTASLVASYWAWTREAPADDDEVVVVVDVAPDELDRIEYRSDDLDLDLVSRSDSRGDYLWVTATERKKERSAPIDDGHGHGADAADDDAEDAGDAGDADEDAEDAGEKAPEIVVTTKEFKAGKNGDELLALLNPLEAERALDTVPDDKLAELELTEPAASVTLVRKGKEPRTLQLGGEAYGTKDRYLRDVGSGRIYLVDDEFVRPLKYGNTRLPDRELFGVDIAEMASLVIAGPTGSLELEQRNRDDEENAFWAAVGAEEPAEVAATWLEKVLRLKSASYVQAEDVPASTEEAFSLQITDVDGTTVTFEVSSGVNPDGDETWYGRSGHTRELVRLHNGPASQAAEDLVTVFE